MHNEWIVCFSLKLKLHIERLLLLNKHGIVSSQLRHDKTFRVVYSCPLYVVHVMSKTAADKIQEARLKGKTQYVELLDPDRFHLTRSSGIW